MKVINEKSFNLSKRRDDFLNSDPFPFLVIDDFLDDDFFSSLAISSYNESSGKKFSSDVEDKKWISLNSALPEKVAMIVNALNSSEWLEEMRGLTEIESLVTTDVGNTKLANFHGMEPGAYLGPHVDHSYEPDSEFPHVLNIILFLTKGWDEKDGGSTMFFDKNGGNLVSKVGYKENRAVIFLHTPYSFHGVERVSKDAKNKRYSIYVDYYSKSLEPYNNIPLKFDKKWFKHGTTFKLEKFSDYFKPKNFSYTKTLILYKLNQFGLGH